MIVIDSDILHLDFTVINSYVWKSEKQACNCYTEGLDV